MSEKVEKIIGNMLKIRKSGFALIAIHAKLRIVDSGVSKGFSFPMKGMAKMAFNIHSSKIVNLPSKIKRMVSNRKKIWWLWLWQ